MSTVAGIVLHNVLKSPEDSITIWAKLKAVYFGSGYSRIFTSIAKYYIKHNSLPSFNELKTINARDKLICASISALEKLEYSEDVSVDIWIESLIDEYVQNESLKKLKPIIDKITIMDSDEIKTSFSDLVMYLEEKTHTSEQVFTMSDILILDEEEKNSKVFLGINNSFDAETGGVALTELIMIGGHRGSGKSIVSMNVMINQYTQGNSAVFFSIEMRAREIYERTMSALSGVALNKIRKHNLTDYDLDKLARVKCDMYLDSDKFYEQYTQHNDFKRLEFELAADGRLRPDNQMLIIDNQTLTLADIDLNLQKFKSQFGDKLKVAVVDYVNQIAIDDMYNWQSQVLLAKGLKNLARKYNITIVAPYQIDASGEARFAKGLLDPADIALKLEAKDNAIKFETTKARNIASTSFASEMDWETQRLSAMDAVIEEAPKEEKKKEKKFVKKDDDLPF